MTVIVGSIPSNVVAGFLSCIGYKVLKLINEKYPEYNSAHVFVQGVLKGYDHWVPGTLIAAEQFVRAFELRLPSKKYVTKTTKAIVDTVMKSDTTRCVCAACACARACLRAHVCLLATML